jgi:hypothetical protein
MSAGFTTKLLNRFVRPQEPDLSAAMARHIIAFELSDDERAHLEALAEKNGQGILSPQERADYELLVLLGEFLTLMKCKARLSLQHPAPAA